MVGIAMRLASVSIVAASAQVNLTRKDTIPGYLAKYGIHVEEHVVETDDGYLLTVFRLPKAGAPPIILNHGLVESAWDFEVDEPQSASAIQMYNMGYDVWLTNNRGNEFSMKHKTLKPAFDKKFWDFSWHEMGHHDLPANIDYVLAHTGKDKLMYACHSQGSSQMFAAMGSSNSTLKTFLEQKVEFFLSLAPAVYMSNQGGLLLNAIVDLHLDQVLHDLWPYGFLTWTGIEPIEQFFCKVTNGKICKIFADVLSGVSEMDDPWALVNLTAHFPAGCSVKQLVHYAQEIRSGHFRPYDYGARGNLERYGRLTPPDYDLSKAANVPTAVLYGGKDKLADPKDVEKTIRELPAGMVKFKQEFPTFSHMTWVVGTHSAFEAWFPVAQDLLGKYYPLKQDVIVV